MKEYILGHVEKGPAPVQAADRLLAKLLANHIVLRSSYIADKDYPNLRKGAPIENREIRLGLVDAPKGAPHVVFVGKESDLKGMKAAFLQGETTETWSLKIQSTNKVSEGERTITIVNGFVCSDIMKVEDRLEPLVISTRAMGTGNLIEGHPSTPADGIIVFVGTRLSDTGTEIASINAVHVGD